MSGRGASFDLANGKQKGLGELLAQGLGGS